MQIEEWGGRIRKDVLVEQPAEVIQCDSDIGARDANEKGATVVEADRLIRFSRHGLPAQLGNV